MTRFPASIALAGLAALSLARAASAAEPPGPARADGPGYDVVSGFLATCEDLGRLCFADACGRDQIEAALVCQARCPSSVVMSVVPAACPIPAASRVILRRRG